MSISGKRSGRASMAERLSQWSFTVLKNHPSGKTVIKHCLRRTFLSHGFRHASATVSINITSSWFDCDCQAPPPTPFSIKNIEAVIVKKDGSIRFNQQHEAWGGCYRNASISLCCGPSQGLHECKSEAWIIDEGEKIWSFLHKGLVSLGWGGVLMVYLQLFLWF